MPLLQLEALPLKAKAAKKAKKAKKKAEQIK
jgi:hypothetical protein